ncbi:hypothetical protein BDY24DRAFT_400679 [Mrakia frigida]|uniref:uncharacterized protein n=1 Tax=Mrakia frigida TaxID=29902 RepID=UPI003FCC1044
MQEQMDLDALHPEDDSPIVLIYSNTSEPSLPTNYVPAYPTRIPRDRRKENKARKAAEAARKKRNKDKMVNSDGEDANDDEDDDSVPENEGVVEKSKRLPPLFKIEDIFADLTKNAKGLEEFARELMEHGEKIKVATMCSGTESPLLALGLVSRALKAQTGVDLQIDHGFSCEIEPYKQAYIERNFAPPILFADVTELGDLTAHNAYGAKIPVPIDNYTILVAGTSCVDFSNLNKTKKKIDDKGESGRTWMGMLRWVMRARPMIVILENVGSAPWDQMVDAFERIGYAAESTKFDTKNYYIPHTRSRGYQVCFRKPDWDPWHPNAASIIDKLPFEWEEKVKAMQRPCSSPLEAFLLSSDDPRIHQARLDLSKKTLLAMDEKSRQPTDWGRCQSRHERSRHEERLGDKRPATAWSEAGPPQLKDGAWQDWAVTQTERVLDLTDVNTLRKAQQGYDAMYKNFVWNLSQNVDRETGSSRIAVSPCLTPNMIPFITDRGGPVVGLEALGLQGLPVENLLLTRETQDQLASLAGNAMSATVVGTAMIAALIVGRELFGLERKSRALEREKIMDVDVDEEPVEEKEMPALVEVNIKGAEKLVSEPLDLSASVAIPITTLLEDGSRSARHCECEGLSDIATSTILRCKACGHQACEACAGRPEHEYDDSKVSSDRLSPREFGDELKKMVPTRLSFEGVNDETMEDARKKGVELGVVLLDKDWNFFKNSFVVALGPAKEYRYTWVKRRDIWSIRMESSKAWLQLDLDPVSPTWYVFVRAEPTDGGLSRRRILLQPPAARLQLDKTSSSVFSGKWEVSLPSSSSFQISIQGRGEKLPSWKNTLGLVDFQEELVYAEIDVSVPKESLDLLDQDISGRYFLNPNCGTAQDSLFIRPASEGKKAISFFLDPTRSGNVEEDGFVFASRSDRLSFGDYRTIIAKIDCAWRPPIQDPAVSPEVECTVLGTWVVAPSVALSALKDAVAIETSAGSLVPSATISLPPPNLDFDFAPDSCLSSTAILTLSVSIAHPELEPPLWKEGEWNQIDLRLKAKDFSETTAWIMERLPELKAFEEWSTVEHEAVVEENDEATTCCERCAPTPPMITWQMSNTQVLMPMEDPVEAGKFEQALKHRPAPFVVQARLDGNVGTIRLGLNVATLLHKAISTLPPSKSTSAPTLSWRLTPNHPSVESTIYTSKQFIIKSNKQDPTTSQPPSFKKFPLRPEQLRSFGWAMKQERPEGDFSFEEEEISEATLGPLGWRAEGKASRKVLVRGGVIADAVGYGKTAVCLGLIDASTKLESLESLSPSSNEFVYSKATLVVVPPHLTEQWESEAKKFLGQGYTVKRFMTFADLRKFTIEDYQNADILIICTSLFNSPIFWESLAAFSAVGSLPKGKEPTRYWSDRFQECLAGARAQVEILNKSAGTSKGVRRVLEKIDAAFVDEERMFKEAMERGEVRIGRKKFDKAVLEKLQMLDEKKKVPIKTAAQRSKQDMFLLNSAQVRLDWTKLRCAPIHTIMFERIIVDEFTYVEGKPLFAINALNSHATWVLSGTPDIQSFNQINAIAELLHVHLGVPDDLGKGSSKNHISTSAELFHSFREVHSQEWRAHRDDVGQRFLDAFVRQNVAEIGEIPLTTHIARINLPAAEKALYLELEHHLNTMNESGVKISSAFKTIKKTTAKSVADRSRRLAQVLDNAKDLRETLIRRCSGFQPPDPPAVEVDSEEEEFDEDGEKLKKKKKIKKLVFHKAVQSATADETCQRIVNARGEQLDLCKEDLRLSLKLAVYHFGTIDWKGLEPSPLIDFVKNSFRSEQDCEGDRDPDSIEILRKLLVEWGCDESGKIGKQPTLTEDELELRSGTQSWLKTISKGKTQADTAKVQTKERAATWDVRERTHVLRGLDKELRSRHRSLRFFNAVREIQLNGANEEFKCPNVNCDSEDTVEIISSSCGHSACSTCMRRQARAGLKCPIQGCKNTLGPPHLLPVSKLLESIGGDSGKYGAKMQELIRIVREEASPKKENVLVFAQFSLVDTIQDALTAEKIKCTVIKGNATAQSKAVSKFQANNEGETTVLVLDPSNASAAGANLTQANHAIFFHPIHLETKHQYVSTDTQAVGRLQRFGQKRMVHIWRLGAVDTVDETIWRERTGRKFNQASVVDERRKEEEREPVGAVVPVQELDVDMEEEPEMVEEPAQQPQVEVEAEIDEIIEEEEDEVVPAIDEDVEVDSPMVEDKSEVPSPSVEDFEEPLLVVEAAEVEVAMVVDEEEGEEVVAPAEEELVVVAAAAAAAALGASKVDVDALLEGVCAEDFDVDVEEDF